MSGNGSSESENLFREAYKALRDLYEAAAKDPEAISPEDALALAREILGEDPSGEDLAFWAEVSERVARDLAEENEPQDNETGDNERSDEAPE